jgi:hypothetical protein
MTVEDNAVPRQTIYQFERTYLEKLRLAVDVILAAAPDGRLVSDPLEVELGFFKDRVEFALLLPSAAADAFPWHDKNDGDNPRPS